MRKKCFNISAYWWTICTDITATTDITVTGQYQPKASPNRYTGRALPCMSLICSPKVWITWKKFAILFCLFHYYENNCWLKQRSYLLVTSEFCTSQVEAIQRNPNAHKFSGLSHVSHDSAYNRQIKEIYNIYKKEVSNYLINNLHMAFGGNSPYLFIVISTQTHCW